MLISCEKNKIVSTEYFWELMQKAAFRRIDYHHGVIGDTAFEVLTPPEETRLISDAVDYLAEFSRPSLFRRMLKKLGFYNDK